MPETSERTGTFKRFLIGALIIVAASTGATVVAANHEVNKVVSAFQHTGHIKGIEKVITQADPGKPQTILLMGSDRRSRNSIDSRLGLLGKPNSDTMMLMRLDASKSATALLSFPRDLKVLVPGFGYGKLNSAYGDGGARLVVQTIEGLDPRIRINHVIDVNFGGFAKAVNSLGCIFVDVDRRYYNASDLYSKINLQPGYQRLCGQDALAYVRYRHDDNDLIRATRQQDFLRDVKAQVGAFGIINDRNKLLQIFARYTSSDLHSRSSILRLLTLAVAVATHPIEEIHFPARLGPSYVYASQTAIEDVVNKFLGVPSVHSTTHVSHAHHRRSHRAVTGLVDGSAAMRDQALQAHNAGLRGLRVYYPTRIVGGSSPVGPPHVYTITTRNGKRYAAYRLVVQKPLIGEYYGLQGTTFTDAPLLGQPHSSRTLRGRTFNIYQDGSRTRLVSWRSGNAVYWISNTLTESISPQQMLALAASTNHL